LPGKSHKYRCWKKGGHGHVDLHAAIAQSCDVYFYRLAQDLGIDRLHEYLTRFGFGRTTGVDLPNEAAGVMPSASWKRRVRNVIWYPGETLITGIGQGFMLATPLQLATAAATLGNRGVAMRPMVASHAEDQVTHEVEEIKVDRTLPSIAVHRENWARIVAAMQAVVHSPIGTAKAVGVGAEYQFAGKTGTSQVFGIKQNQTVDAKKLNKKLWDHGLFIAFAPVEKPMIAVAVIVEHGGSGSGAAAPIARKVFDHYLAAGNGSSTPVQSGG
jgi:penicillin-binding protein 2